MSTLSTYNGIQVVSPEPAALGGKAINDNFKALSTPLNTTNPGTSDDSANGFSVGSRWFNSATETEFICTDATAAHAVWAVLAAPSPWTTGTSQIYYNGGNVGIGTSSPAATLDVNGGAYFVSAYASISGDTTVGVSFQIDTPVAKGFWVNPNYLAEDSLAGVNTTDGSAAFAGGNMVIDPAGHVGIGTTSPASPLDVTGASSSDSFVAKPQSSAPSSPLEGQIYYDSTSHHFFGWNGTAWKQLDN